MRKLHLFSGIFLSLFVTLHLCNHLLALHSVELHIYVMELLRVVYQHPVVESFLLLAIVVQIMSGIQLIRQRKWRKGDLFTKLQVYSGMYLAFFLFAHTSATLYGRLGLAVDTNFYYAAMVVNTSPHLFFFVPYYFLGTLAFMVHLACLLRLFLLKKRGKEKAEQWTKLWIGFGLLVAVLILIGLMYEVELPATYQQIMEMVYS